MADRRMLSKSIMDTDNFIEMPSTARLLYVDLVLRADDDGFISPRKVMKVTGASEDDLRILIAKKYLIPFNTGIVAITHWRFHNYIRSDNYHPTIYQREKACLKIPTTRSADRSYKLINCKQTTELIATDI